MQENANSGVGRRYSLKERVALVTGAGQGIGRAITIALAQEGAAVVICGRTLKKLETVAEEIKQLGQKALTIVVRIEKKAEVQNMIEQIMNTFGRIDYLVNNAGITRAALVTEMTEEEWDTVLNTNLKGAFLVSQAVARLMIKAGFGSIVNMCSIASYAGQEGRANYAASKAGLMALTWVMAQELAAYNIRVNGVAPALIGTEMIKRGVPQDFLKDVILDRKPLARLGTPEEVADAVLFLLSERASYINGEVLKVDGGLLSGYFCSNQRAGESFIRKK